MCCPHVFLDFCFQQCQCPVHNEYLSLDAASGHWNGTHGIRKVMYSPNHTINVIMWKIQAVILYKIIPFICSLVGLRVWFGVLVSCCFATYFAMIIYFFYCHKENCCHLGKKKIITTLIKWVYFNVPLKYSFGGSFHKLSHYVI
jgi:hypothetical protein